MKKTITTVGITFAIAMVGALVDDFTDLRALPNVFYLTGVVGTLASFFVFMIEA